MSVSNHAQAIEQSISPQVCAAGHGGTLAPEQIVAAGEAMELRIEQLLRGHIQQPLETMLAELNIGVDSADFFRNVRVAATQVEPLELEIADIELGGSSDYELAAANLASRAEYLYQNELKELEQRMRWLSKQGFKVATQAWAPETLAVAFSELVSEQINNLEAFSAFEKNIIPKLDGFYRAANEELDQTCLKLNDLTAQSTQPGDESSVAASALQARAEIAHAVSTAPESTGVDSKVTPDLSTAMTAVSCLRAAGISNRSAQGLSNKLGVPTTEISVVESPAVAHHLLAVLIRQIVDDACLPSICRPLIEGLRQSLRCAALRDPRFFTDASHPVRCLMADIAQMACSIHDPSAESFKKFEAFVNRVENKLTGSGEPDPLPKLMLSEEAVERFTLDERQRRRDRRRLITECARDQVAQVVDEAIYGKKLPQAVRQIISKGIAPMLVMHYVKAGNTSEQWRAGRQLLSELVASVDATGMQENARQHRQMAMQLSGQLRVALDSAGLSAQQIRLMINRLQAIYDGLSAQADARLLQTAITPQASETQESQGIAAPHRHTSAEPGSRWERRKKVVGALAVLLRYGSWFKVFDKHSGRARWLKVSSFNPERVTVSFSQFNGDSVVEMSGWVFARELVDGCSEPVNPDAGVKEILAQLRVAVDEGIVD